MNATNNQTQYKSYDELPASLNVSDVAKALNVSRAQAYILANREDFPKIKVGPSRMIIPKSSFLEWMSKQLPNYSMQSKSTIENQKVKQLINEQIVSQQDMIKQILQQQHNLQQLLNTL